MQRGRNLEEKNTEGKKPRNNGEVMATFVKNGRQIGKGKEGLKNLTLEEKKKMKYSFHDDDVEGIFNELMKEKAIQLLEPKRPSEVDKIVRTISQGFRIHLVHPITTRVNPHVRRFTKGFSCPICEFKEESFNR